MFAGLALRATRAQTRLHLALKTVLPPPAHTLAGLCKPCVLPPMVARMAAHVQLPVCARVHVCSHLGRHYIGWTQPPSWMDSYQRNGGIYMRDEPLHVRYVASLYYAPSMA